MEDEFASYRMALAESAKERRRLSLLREEKVREYQTKVDNMKQRGESPQAFAARKLVVEAEGREALTAIENMLRIEDDREHAAREGLAKAARQRAGALASLEDAAYTGRRAPIGEGIRLTEKDFQNAQKSVPLVAFVLSLAAVILAVVVIASSISAPTGISVAEFVFALLVAVAFGIRADYFARRADRRAEEGRAEGAGASQSPPAAQEDLA